MQRKNIILWLLHPPSIQSILKQSIEKMLVRIEGVRERERVRNGEREGVRDGDRERGGEREGGDGGREGEMFLLFYF
jgi:hypothetical protein